MRRAVVLTTLTLILLTVTGITIGQERGFGPERDYQTEPTAMAVTRGEITELVDEKPAEQSEPAIGDVVENSEADEAHYSQLTEDEAAEGNGEGAGKPEGVGKLKAKGVGKPEVVGRPEGVGKPEGVGRPGGAGGPVGKGKPVGVDKAEKAGEYGGRNKPKEGMGKANGGGGQQKVPMCHKAKNTITVGAPAREAHLRHGDILGACE